MSKYEYFSDMEDREHIASYEDMLADNQLPYPLKMAGRTISIRELMRKKPNGAFRIAGRILEISEVNSVKHFQLYDGSGSILVEARQMPTYIQEGDIVEIESDNCNGCVTPSSAKIMTKSLIRLMGRSEFVEMGDNYRKMHRDLEMIVNPDLKATFINISKINSLIRRFHEDRGFVEVETPFLLPYPEVSPNRAFSTEEPIFSQKADLRRTNTEYIRRLMIAGFEKVYQLGKCFRDEPASFKHLPEFTQLTFGIAYQDYNALMKNIEEMSSMVVHAINGTYKITFRDRELDFSPPWRRISVRDALIEHTGIDIDKFDNEEDLSKEARSKGLQVPDRYEYEGFLKMATLVDKLIEDNVNARLLQPTFLCEYPWYLGGPAKELETNPKYKKRAEVFVGGVELANISTPQNDPFKIKKWYTETIRLKQEHGWKNARLDKLYLQALGQGIPICATGGLGVDRLIMFALKKDRVEDVVLFPWRNYKQGGYNV